MMVEPSALLGECLCQSPSSGIIPDAHILRGKRERRQGEEARTYHVQTTNSDVFPTQQSPVSITAKWMLFNPRDRHR